MRAAAILGPAAKERELERFRARGVELTVVPEVPAGERYDAVLIFGGDGTVHRQLAHLKQSQTPLLVVPVGSGNDFARQLRLNTERRAWRAWRKFCAGAGNVREIDLGVICPLGSERGLAAPRAPAPVVTAAVPAAGAEPAEPPEVIYFSCIGGVGLDAETNRRANRMPRWLRGHGGYALAAVREIPSYRFPRMRVERQQAKLAAGGGSRGAGGAMAANPGAEPWFDEPATLLVFANSQSYGHGMRMAPRASVDDGLLDIIFVRQTTRARLLRFFPTVFTGRHLQLPEVQYCQAPCLRVETEPAMDVYADGEYICRTPIEVTVAERALRVIV